jgi:hypothetical protein
MSNQSNSTNNIVLVTYYLFEQIEVTSKLKYKINPYQLSLSNFYLKIMFSIPNENSLQVLNI